MIDETEIHRMVNSTDVEERKTAVGQICDDFAYISDKDAACSDLIQLMQDEDINVQRNATWAIVSVFSHIPDKDTVWSDLHQLTQDGDKSVQGRIAWVLASAFSHIPDKNAAWSDLIQLAQDGNEKVHFIAASMFGSAFSHIPDKDTAWSDLHRLTQDGDSYTRRWAIDVLGHAFSHIPDKNAAWCDLHRLTQDGNRDVRIMAAEALGSVFSHIFDKGAAWSTLHRLIQDEDIYVRWRAAGALGSAFSHIPDKNLAWSTLHRLTQNENKNMRMYAYHSLGSASVYKATATEDEEKFRAELKKSIDYFEKSSQEAEYEFHNPASFCLPFYRSYYAVISGQQDAEAEAVKYIGEAKKVTSGSESREALLEAVEYLANALKEAQKPLDFGETKEHLKACRQYCDHTAKLADSARGKSPVAAAAIERGIPIVGMKVKEIIAEIQEKAKEACQQAQGTPAEEIACAVNREVQKWNISDQDGMTKNVENMIFCLKSLVPKTSRNNNLHEKIEEIRLESDVMKQYTMFLMFIPLISTPSPRKSWTTIFDSSSTHGALAGFLFAGFGTIFYPSPYLHFISAIVAVYVFSIVSILKSIKKERKHTS